MNQWKRGRLLGKKIGHDTVVCVTDELNAHSQRIVIIRCELCQEETPISSNVLMHKEKHGETRRCQGCAAKRVAAAVASPLIMTDLQWKDVMISARKAVFCTTGHADDADDVVAEAMVILLLRGGSAIDHNNVGGMAFRVAQNVAKRGWDRKPDTVSEIASPDVEDEFIDVFDRTESEIQPTALKEKQQELLDSIPKISLDWLLKYQNLNHRKTADTDYATAGREKFERLVGPLRAALKQYQDEMKAPPAMVV